MTERDADRPEDAGSERGAEDGAGDAVAGADGDDPEPAEDADEVAERFADAPLPASVLEEAERLTRLARNAVDPDERAAYRERRETLLREYDYTTRVREEDDTLVRHPQAWMDDGTVRTERIDDVSNAVEISLAGPGDPDDWAALDERNRALVERVRAEHGPVHAANADRFADFMGNHCAKHVTAATRPEIERFLGEYYVRNAWPDPREREVVLDSLERLFEVGDASLPSFSVPAHLEDQ